jgi:hypothetical protein
MFYGTQTAEQRKRRHKHAEASLNYHWQIARRVCCKLSNQKNSDCTAISGAPNENVTLFHFPLLYPFDEEIKPNEKVFLLSFLRDTSHVESC